jgi:UDP-N-acetylmuramoyl-tripeptide--D-alanyl-D-alanine ligase
MTDVLVAVALAAALALASLRWLRVGQREHYVPGRVRVIARIWFSRSGLDAALLAVAALLVVAAVVVGLVVGRGLAAALLGLAGAVLAALLPRGLGVRGRTSRLAWTGRLRRLAAALAVLAVALGALLWWLAGVGAAAALVVGAPLLIDLALAVTDPVEKRLSAPFVARAQQRLARVRPTVVAVTGSYGKTSTKGYIAHALSASRSVVASPASFNNRLGLSRAVNDHLVDGTEVFVAEMGTFGPGEIRELCALFPPDVAVITTIGEAHLERMGSREAIARAKGEITERARAVVLPVDDPLLADLAERCRAEGKRVVTVSTEGREADVVVDIAAGRARVAGPDGTAELALPDAVPHAVNLGVALGVALALDVDPAALRLGGLPRAAHRAEVHAGPGVAVVDDTYNANPVGARTALAEAAALAAERGGPLVVVTPGIVELGPVQAERNADFARAVVEAGARLVVVGRTNRAALLAGARAAGAEPDVVDVREQAVPLATAAAGERGVVLYENDLPDHYP